MGNITKILFLFALSQGYGCKSNLEGKISHSDTQTDCSSAENECGSKKVSDKPLSDEVEENASIEKIDPSPESKGDQTENSNEPVPPLPALHASYSFEAATWTGAASEVIDSSSFANHGQAVRNTNVVAGGPSGKWASLDGDGSKLFFPGGNLFDFSSDKAISFFFEPTLAFDQTSLRDQTLLDTGNLRIYLGRNDGKLTVESALSNHIWNSDFSLNTTHGYEQVYSQISYKGNLYVGLGYDAGEGDVYMCTPEAGGNLDECDHSADWTLSFDHPIARQLQTLYEHNGYLYAGTLFPVSSEIYICKPAGSGDPNVCEPADWSQAKIMTAIVDSVWGFGTYKGRLYVGVGEDYNQNTGGGNVFYCEPSIGGDNDACDHTSDWISTQFSTYSSTGWIRGFVEFEGVFYAYGGGGGSGSNEGKLYRCDPTGGGDPTICDTNSDWSTSYNSTHEGIWSATVLDNRLYFSTGHTGVSGKIYMCDPKLEGNTGLCDHPSDFDSVYNGTGFLISHLVTHAGRLYAADSGAGIVASCNPSINGNLRECDHEDDWATEFDTTVVEPFSLGVHNGRLYLGSCCDAGMESTPIYTQLKSTISSWPSGTTQHLGVGFESGEIKLYLNGLMDSSMSTVGPIASPTTSYYLGGGLGTNTPLTYPDSFNGHLDEFRLFESNLSDAQWGTFGE